MIQLSQPMLAETLVYEYAAWLRRMRDKVEHLAPEDKVLLADMLTELPSPMDLLVMSSDAATTALMRVGYATDTPGTGIVSPEDAEWRRREDLLRDGNG